MCYLLVDEGSIWQEEDNMWWKAERTLWRWHLHWLHSFKTPSCSLGQGRTVNLTYTVPVKPEGLEVLFLTCSLAFSFRLLVILCTFLNSQQEGGIENSYKRMRYFSLEFVCHFHVCQLLDCGTTAVLLNLSSSLWMSVVICQGKTKIWKAMKSS